MNTTSTSTQPVVMVTGAAGRLGSELVQAFSKHGYRVFATARNIPEQQEARVTWHKLDATDDVQCKETLVAGFDRFGRIDVLINNASGYTGGTTITKMGEVEFREECRDGVRAIVDKDLPEDTLCECDCHDIFDVFNMLRSI